MPSITTTRLGQLPNRGLVIVMAAKTTLLNQCFTIEPLQTYAGAERLNGIKQAAFYSTRR